MNLLHWLCILVGIILLLLLILLIIRTIKQWSRKNKTENFEAFATQKWTPWFFNGIYPVTVKEVNKVILLCIQTTPPVAEEIPTFFIQKMDTNGPSAVQSPLTGLYQIICSYKDKLYYVGGSFPDPLNPTYLWMASEYIPEGFRFIVTKENGFYLVPTGNVDTVSVLFCMDNDQADHLYCFCVGLTDDFYDNVEYPKPKVLKTNFPAMFTQEYSANYSIYDGLYMFYAFNNSTSDQTLRYFNSTGDQTQIVIHPGLSTSYFCGQDIMIDNNASVQNLCSNTTSNDCNNNNLPQQGGNTIHITWNYSQCIEDGEKYYSMNEPSSDQTVTTTSVFFQITNIKCKVDSNMSKPKYLGKLVIMDPNPNNTYIITSSMDNVDPNHVVYANMSGAYISVSNNSQNQLSWSFATPTVTAYKPSKNHATPADMYPTQHSIPSYNEFYLDTDTGNSVQDDQNRFNIVRFLAWQIFNLVVDYIYTETGGIIFTEIMDTSISSKVGFTIFDDWIDPAVNFAADQALTYKLPNYSDMVQAFWNNIKNSTNILATSITLSLQQKDIIQTALVKSDQLTIDKWGNNMKSFLQRVAQDNHFILTPIINMQTSSIQTAYLCTLLLGTDKLKTATDAFNEMIKTTPRNTVLKQIQSSRKIAGITDDKQVDIFILFQVSLLNIFRLPTV